MREKRPEEEEPCTNSLEFSQAAKTKTHPTLSCILCLYATSMVLHFNVSIHMYLACVHSDPFHFLPVWSLLSPQKAGPGLFRLTKVEVASERERG